MLRAMQRQCDIRGKITIFVVLLELSYTIYVKPNNTAISVIAISQLDMRGTL